MSLRIEKHGWTVSGDTPEELAAGIAAVEQVIAGGPPKPKRGRPPGPTSSTQAKLRERLRLILRHLEAISSAADGISQTDLMLVMGWEDSRQIGSQASSTNSLLRDLGFGPTQVYEKTRVGGKSRWYRTELTAQAISVVEEKLIAMVDAAEAEESDCP